MRSVPLPPRLHVNHEASPSSQRAFAQEMYLGEFAGSVRAVCALQLLIIMTITKLEHQLLPHEGVPITPQCNNLENGLYCKEQTAESTAHERPRGIRCLQTLNTRKALAFLQPETEHMPRSVILLIRKCSTHASNATLLTRIVTVDKGMSFGHIGMGCA